MPPSPRGPLGTSINDQPIDRGTRCQSRSSLPGPYCASRDPGLLEKTGYVLRAWELAKYQYAPGAIVRHTEKALYEVVAGILPTLFVAIGGLIASTVIGALVGSLAGGVGAAPGAAAGLGIGLFALEWLGVGFLALYIAENIGDAGLHIYTGAGMAWNSRGTDSIGIAAREMAEGIGVFFEVLVQAAVGMIAKKGLSKVLAKVKNSKLGSGFGGWLKDRVSLSGFLKAVEKPPGDYAFTLDGIGRPIEAEGWLVKADGITVRGAADQVTAGLNGFHAGHLIPNTFKGPASVQNMVPMAEVMNLSYVKVIENLSGRYLKEGPIYLKVTVEYSGGGKIPSAVRHRLYRLGKDNMELIPGGDITTNVGFKASQAMGKVVNPRDFLSTDPTKGVANKLPF